MPVQQDKKSVEEPKETPHTEIKRQVEDEKPIVFDLTDDILNVEVNDPIEVVPTPEMQHNEVRKYSLEDYMEEEKRLSEAKPAAQVLEEDEEIVFEKKTITQEPEEKASTENVDPVDQPISETLRARAAERRAKMKEFNYKFRNSSNIEEIEKEPAYKRAGIDVDSRPDASGLSRTSLGTDENDEIQLRRNNSFLHDNVD